MGSYDDDSAFFGIRNHDDASLGLIVKLHRFTQSKLKAAKCFRGWVTGWLIPCIKRTVTIKRRSNMKVYPTLVIHCFEIFRWNISAVWTPYFPKYFFLSEEKSLKSPSSRYIIYMRFSLKIRSIPGWWWWLYIWVYTK